MFLRAALLILLFMGLWPQAPAWAAPGTVQVVMGQVRIIQANGQERPAIKGDHLREGDTVTTGPASNVQIRMIDDALVWLRPQSRFTIEKYPPDAGRVNTGEAATRLAEGGLRMVTGAIGKSRPEQVKLTTPNATIGIRGTEFEAAYVGGRRATELQVSPGTYNRVFEGRTVLANAMAQQVLVERGQAAFMGLEPQDRPQVLTRVPAFLDEPLPPSVGTGAAAAPPPKAREADKPPPRMVQVGLRISSPAAAGGAQVVASAGAPVEPIETSARVREGETTRLSLAWSAPPSTQQRRAPPPPVTVAVELSVQMDGDRAQVQAQWIGQNAPMPISMPLGTWFDVTGRSPMNRPDRQVISSSSARPESALVMLRVDPLNR